MGEKAYQDPRLFAVRVPAWGEFLDAMFLPEGRFQIGQSHGFAVDSFDSMRMPLIVISNRFPFFLYFIIEKAFNEIRSNEAECSPIADFYH
jgi:hypothetical protein